MERIKDLSYTRQSANCYFWRTYNKKELDWVEETGGHLHGYEFKWKNAPVNPPRDWLETYPEADFQIIHLETYLRFVTPA